MALPLLLLAFALLAAAFAAYGTDPSWVTLSNGLELIFWSRRLQWPAFTVCLLLCSAVVLLVVSGKRRAWWLLGLLPILALFGHRFSTSPMRDFRVADNPPLAEVADAHGVKDDDFVVGMMLGENAVAYPYSMLFRSPVVVQAAGGQRALLVWNPYANLARAAWADREIRAQELEVVSMPANATLVYNSRDGLFINGVTLQSQHDVRPPTLGKPIGTTTTTFGRWKSWHPRTKVALGADATAPAVPLRPRYPIPSRATTRPAESSAEPLDPDAVETPVILLATSRPSVVPPADVSDRPANFTVEGEPVLLFRDPLTLQVRAYSRVIPPGLELLFAPAPQALSTTRPAVTMVDTASRTAWSAGGAPQDPASPHRAHRLTAVDVDEGPYFAVLKYWYPDLHVHHVTDADFADLPEVRPPVAPRPQRQTPSRRRTR